MYPNGVTPNLTTNLRPEGDRPATTTKKERRASCRGRPGLGTYDDSTKEMKRTGAIYDFQRKPYFEVYCNRPRGLRSHQTDNKQNALLCHSLWIESSQKAGCHAGEGFIQKTKRSCVRSARETSRRQPERSGGGARPPNERTGVF